MTSAVTTPEVPRLPQRRSSTRAWSARRRLHALAEIRRFLARPDLDELTDYQRASEGRQLMSGLTQELAHAGVSVSDAGVGADYWPTFLQNVEGVLARIGIPGR